MEKVKRPSSFEGCAVCGVLRVTHSVEERSTDMADGPWLKNGRWRNDTVLEPMVMSFLRNCPFDQCLSRVRY